MLIAIICLCKIFRFLTFKVKQWKTDCLFKYLWAALYIFHVLNLIIFIGSVWLFLFFIPKLGFLLIDHNSNCPCQMGLENTPTADEQDQPPPLLYKCPVYNTKQSDGESPVLKLWGMWNTLSLLLLPGPQWHGVVASDRYIDQWPYTRLLSFYYYLRTSGVKLWLTSEFMLNYSIVMRVRTSRSHPLF